MEFRSHADARDGRLQGYDVIPIGDFGVLIAAHAFTLDLTLVTNNARPHFSRVRGLKSETWL